MSPLFILNAELLHNRKPIDLEIMLEYDVDFSNRCIWRYLSTMFLDILLLKLACSTSVGSVLHYCTISTV